MLKQVQKTVVSSDIERTSIALKNVTLKVSISNL